MDLILISMIQSVKTKPRTDPMRKNVCELVLKDMPLIIKNEFINKFLPQERNKGKDIVDYYFIKNHQISKFFKTGEEPKIRVPKKEKENVKKKQIPFSEIKDTMRIGGLINK